jgi:hypothetical protein
MLSLKAISDRLFSKNDPDEVELEIARPCAKQSPEPYPVGFFKALSRLAGVPIGLGYYCRICKILYQAGLETGDRIRCCGDNMRVPAEARITETHRVGFYRR